MKIWKENSLFEHSLLYCLTSISSILSKFTLILLAN